MTTLAPKSASALVAALGGQLHAGIWPQGARLSTRELGRRFGAHRATVQRALRRLQSQGLVECRPRSGWYVQANMPQAIRSEVDRPRTHRHAPARVEGNLQVALTIGIDPGHQLFNESSWTNVILSHLRARLAEHQVDLLLWSHSPTVDAEPGDVARRLEDAAGRIMGVVAINPLELEPVESLLDDRGVPWITVNRRHPKVLHNFVGPDNAWAGRTVGRAFAAMGWRHIVLIVGDMDQYPSEREKFEGFCGGYASIQGCLPDRLEVVTCGGSAQQAGYEVMTRELARREPPQAVFCAGDNIALGAMRAAQDRGLRVPDDIGFVGNSGFEHARWAQPSLTTLAQPMAQIGTVVADMILHMHQRQLLRVPGRMLDGQFILRQSLRVSDEVRAQIEAMQRQTLSEESALSPLHPSVSLQP